MKAKKLYIDEKNRDAIQAAIENAEGKATARTLTVADLESKLGSAERMLMWPSKKDLAGTRVRVHASTEKLPSAYRYRADSTQAVCEHDGKGWILVEVERDTLRQSSANKYGLEIEPSEGARAHILATLAFC
jgi:hypothetical protein